MHYQFKTAQYAHQAEGFERSKDKKVFAHFMQQGTGKSKQVIDRFGYNFALGRVDALLVVAWPGGVHENWAVFEIPKHLPDYIDRRVGVWFANMRKVEREAVEALFDPEYKGARILCMNVEAFTTTKGKALARRFLNSFRVHFAVDESTSIKTPGARRTKAIRALGEYAVCRDIATGTPVTQQGPLDLYAQFAFLDKRILGFDTFTEFKNHYAVTVPRLIHRYDKRRGEVVEQEIQEVVGFRNVDELYERIAPHCFRVLKKDCLDLPPKVYERHVVHFTPQQATAYRSMKRELMAEVEDTLVEADNGLTKRLRLMQIVSGAPRVLEGDFRRIPTNRPQVALDALRVGTTKALVWCLFRTDVEDMVTALTAEYGAESVVVFHGEVEREDKIAAVRQFNENPVVRWFVCSYAAAYSWTLNAADTCLFYTNHPSYEKRVQAEDRAHRIGQEKTLRIIDLEVPGTVDSDIIKRFVELQGVSDTVLKEQTQEWLS